MRLNIRPARSGLRVINPATGRPLPERGAAVIFDQYWRRRLADGDVVKTRKRKRAPKPETPNADKPAEG